MFRLEPFAALAASGLLWLDLIALFRLIGHRWV
jgi:hypothetical protein